MKRTIYITALTALLIFAFVMGKVEFLCYNRDISFFTISELLRVLLHGLPLDMSTVAFAVLPVWAVTLLTFRWPRLPLRWLVGPYLALATFLMGCITGATIIMYENWKFLIDASILSYMSSPGNASASASTYYIVTRIGLILLCSALLALLTVLITPRRMEKSEPRKRTAASSPRRGLLPYVFCGLVLCFMAWGITGSRVNERSAFHSDKLLLSHAAVNPVGHMARSLLLYRKPIGEHFRLMPDEECDSLFTALFPATTEDVTLSLLLTTRPNILTIQLESMGAPFMETLGGVPGVTPELCHWMSRGVNFTNAWANSFRTDRGTVSVLSGYPAYPTISLMMTDSCLSILPSLARSLKREGYTADYMCGGNANHMNKRKYLEAVGFRVWDIEDIDVYSDERDAWGANDSIAMQRMLGLMQRTWEENGSERPFYWACQTISSHEPWEVPYHRLENKVHNAFAYTDHCVGQFLDSLSRTDMWDNLLVILFADHGNTYGLTFDNPEFFHIPLFFVGGAVSSPRSIDTIVAQNDIVATLLAQMQLSHDDEFPWSRNVLSANYRYPSAYCTWPAGALLVDSTGETIMDVMSEYVMTDRPQPSATRLRHLKAMLQRSYRDLPLSASKTSTLCDKP